MNVLVSGANGQLGNEMRIVAQQSNNNYIFSDIVHSDNVETTILDITKLDEICYIVKEKNISVIVNCAAYTNVDKAESDVELCTLLNSKAPENLAMTMKEVDGTLIHISTDYVFGGDPYNIPCKEEQKGTPTYALDLAKAHSSLPDDIFPDMDLITYVTDRLGHDARYAIDSTKFQYKLGW